MGLTLPDSIYYSSKSVSAPTCRVLFIPTLVTLREQDHSPSCLLLSGIFFFKYKAKCAFGSVRIGLCSSNNLRGNQRSKITNNNS